MFGIYRFIPNSLITIVACIAMVGCSLLTIDVLPMDFPYEAMLERTDIGDGWIMIGSGSSAVDDTVDSYSVSFRYGSEENLANPSIGHTLYVYHAEESAVSGFTTFEGKHFPGSYRPEPPGVSFSPRDVSDNIRLGCREILINNKPLTHCTYLHQHDEYAWVVLISLDEDVITMTDFMQLLERLEFKIYLLEESLEEAA